MNGQRLYRKSELEKHYETHSKEELVVAIADLHVVNEELVEKIRQLNRRLDFFRIARD